MGTIADAKGPGPSLEDSPDIDRTASSFTPAWHERRLVRLALMCLPFIFILVIWQAIAAAEFESLKYGIASPTDTWSQLWDDLTSSHTYNSIAITLQEFAYGLGIGAICGIVLGAALGLTRVLHDIVWPTVVFFQAVPTIALAPLMVIIFGFGIGSKVALAASISFFPILVGVINGVRSVRVEELELMASLNASKWQQFMTIRIPRALPSTFGGFQVGALFALVGAVVTEFLGASAGLGFLISLRSAQLQTPGVFSAIIILAFVGVAVSLSLVFVGNRLSRWEE